ncbi:hypothetical protein CLIB1423_24S00254 [[Candida] railenensis]|uniref:Uncharacterized protein n=1 Tax=[Candida] railenensis TaxID=45579 RepID=A0A9P0QTD1_9ASCO|nr:hypothetical protein CLIB1423_24S00254 [[Candida] railenensis]
MSTLIQSFDARLSDYLHSHPFTSSLIQSPASKVITYLLIISFIILISYETIYWSGIYLGLWEYHAKDIFTEVPIHCAHVYIRVTKISDKEELDQINTFFSYHSNSFLHKNVWNRFISSPIKDATTITYNFEFSPEDFEMNENPEFGSTVEHLKTKILNTYLDSRLANGSAKSGKKLTKDNVLIYNHNFQLLDSTFDNEYLSKCNVETGNLINSYINTT